MNCRLPVDVFCDCSAHIQLLILKTLLADFCRPSSDDAHRQSNLSGLGKAHLSLLLIQRASFILSIQVNDAGEDLLLLSPIKLGELALEH